MGVATRVHEGRGHAQRPWGALAGPAPRFYFHGKGRGRDHDGAGDRSPGPPESSRRGVPALAAQPLLGDASLSLFQRQER